MFSVCLTKEAAFSGTCMCSYAHVQEAAFPFFRSFFEVLLIFPGI